MTAGKYLRSYTAAVMSKDGVIGIGLPCNHCDASRNFLAGSAASLFVPPVLAARRAGASPAGFTQVVAR